MCPGLATSAAAGVAIGAVLYTAAPLALAALGAADGILGPGTAYLRALAFAVPFAAVSFTLQAACAAIDATRAAMYTALLVNAVNLPLGLLLILRADFGVTGEALSTLAATVAGTGYLLVYSRARLPVPSASAIDNSEGSGAVPPRSSSRTTPTDTEAAWASPSCVRPPRRDLRRSAVLYSDPWRGRNGGKGRVVKLVLWDIDRTLLYVGDIDRAVYRETFESIVGHAPTVLPARGTGVTMPLAVRELLSANGVSGIQLDEFAERIAERLPDQLRLHAAEIRDHGQLMPGAVQALSAVQRAQPLMPTVVTGNLQASAEIKLQALGLSTYVDTAVGGYASDDAHRPALVRITQMRAAAAYGCTHQHVTSTARTGRPSTARGRGTMPGPGASGPRRSGSVRQRRRDLRVHVGVRPPTTARPATSHCQDLWIGSGDDCWSRC